MVWLPDGEKILKIGLVVLIQYMNVIDRQTDTALDRQTPHDSILSQHRTAKTVKARLKVHMIQRHSEGYWHHTRSNGSPPHLFYTAHW